jgi:transposase
MAMRREHGVDLIGPIQPSHRWQSKTEGGYTTTDFAIDWDRRQATCPEGRPSVS